MREYKQQKIKISCGIKRSATIPSTEWGRSGEVNATARNAYNSIF